MKGIIFDFNGVLLWDTPLHDCSWREYAVTVRSAPLSDEEIGLHVLGRTNQAIHEYLSGHAVVGDELHQRTQAKERIYRRLCLELGPGFQLSPGAIELLDFLVAHAIPRTIATASEKTNLDFFVEHLKLARWFDIAKIVYDDEIRPGKPAPDMYLQAAQNIGLAPPDCVVIEDSRSGIAAAHAAGIGQIFALGPREDHERLAQYPGVSAVIESLQQFPRELLRQ